VIDHFDLTREIVGIGMNYVDRYLAASDARTIAKNDFQLLSMTCLYLSIKLHEAKHIMVPGASSSMDTILRLGRGHYTLEQMEEMELKILQRLQWRVHPPTPQDFVREFLTTGDLEVQDLAYFMVELSSMDYFFVTYKPSEIAIAALLNAMERLFTHSNHPLDFGLLTRLRALEFPRVSECKERLSMVYAQSTNENPNQDLLGPEEQRTASPVSVTATLGGI
jgi:hypothetical protein